MTLSPDPWLAQLFGCPVWRVAGEDTMLPWPAPAEEPNAFFYAKLPTRSVAQVGALTAAGFRIVDVNLTLDRPATAPVASVLPAGLAVAPFQPGWQAAILDIAASCFVYSRFHLDPHVAPALANEIKRAWIENYCRGRRGDGLLVALVDGQPAGFLAVLAATVHGQTCRVIDLVGVAKSFQGRGVGRALVDAFLREAAGRCDQVRVGTQAANIPSLRLYEQAGFRMADSSYVLHAHYRQGVRLT